MKLEELKNMIDQAYERADGADVDVEIFLQGKDDQETYFEIKSIDQFSLVPDVVIEIKEV